MKKIFLLALIALNSGNMLADNTAIWLTVDNKPPQNSVNPIEFFDENAHCNPCWMKKRLAQIAHTSEDPKNVMEARNLILTKFGPECDQQRAEQYARFKENLKETAIFAAKATVVIGGIMLVGYAVHAAYNKFIASEKTVEITPDSI